jgi:hypothetical protein
MRTSLIEIKDTEHYLLGELSFAETAEFKARISAHPLLRWNVSLQKKLYSILRAYHRKKQKAELASLHTRLFRYGD